MKFSIIIPVYNVEKYLDRCLKSVLDQTYDNYETIIVNDESPDNSQKIIDKYVNLDDRFRSFTKKNGGLSDARNFGVNYVTGEYIVFLDSDDYIEKDLLLNLSKCANENELIKYNLNLVDEQGNIIRKAKPFEKNGKASIADLLNTEFFQPAWSYAYNVEFWKKNNFKYSVGKIHEDFGLTPLCAALAKNIYMLDYYGYNYVQREGSIMNGGSKAKKRAYDMLFHFDILKDEIEKKNINEYDKKLLMSYVANNVISICKVLSEQDLEQYITELKNRQLYKYILNDTFVRKLKRFMVRNFPNQYIKSRFRSKI